MKTLRIAVIMAGLTTSHFALEDTPDNRAKLAERYLKTFPVQDLWQAIEKAIPEEHRELATRVLRNVNWKIVIQAVRETLIKTYTVDEIQAITDAYSSPVGRSILRKQGSFLSVDELRATQEFLSTPIGQSILRKRHTFKYKMQSILKKELLKAVAKVVTEEMERSKRTQRIGSKNYFP